MTPDELPDPDDLRIACRQESAPLGVAEDVTCCAGALDELGLVGKIPAEELEGVGPGRAWEAGVALAEGELDAWASAGAREATREGVGDGGLFDERREGLRERHVADHHEH